MSTVVGLAGQYTARSIIQSMFEQIKIYAPGVQMNAADAARALEEMNIMLDEWSNQRLACFANVEQEIVLVPGQQAYSIGLGGDVNVVRPIAIASGPGAAYLVDQSNNRYPVNVVEQDVWNQIALLNESADLPDTIFYDPQYPLGIINVFPIPTTAYSIFIDSRLQLVDMGNLDQIFSLPPGYMAAIRNNLSLRLWPFYKQGDPTGVLIKQASDSFGTIKRSNIKMSASQYDSAIVSKAKASYNIFNDSQGGRGDA